jgi:hypothetical protein
MKHGLTLKTQITDNVRFAVYRTLRCTPAIALAHALWCFPTTALAQPMPAPAGQTTASPVGLQPPPGTQNGNPCAPAMGPNGAPLPVPANCTTTALATPAAATEKQLDDAEREDSGRKLELVWLRAEAGASYMNLTSFDGKDSFGLVRTSQGGGNVSAAVGLRFVLVSLGARVRLNQFSAFNMWQVNGVLGFHIPIGKVDVAISAHGGYSFEGKLSAVTTSEVSGAQPVAGGNVRVAGLNAGAGFAVDYYVSNNVSVGGGLSAEALFLRRPKLELPADVPPAVRAQLESQPLYKEASSSAGFGIAGGLRIGVHFGL